MSYPLYSAAVVVLGLLWYIAKWLRSPTITQLPGPPSKSWLVGNIPDFQRPKNAGDADFEWMDKYGLAMRTKGCFGENILYLADPKALQYVLNKSGYNFPKTYESRARTRRTTGDGIIWADGAQHSRQRKIMNPAFAHNALKGFLPLFLESGKKTVHNYKANLLQQSKESSVIDVSSWLARTALDVIGQAAFGYKFNSIDNEETELYKSYHNLFADVNYMISDFNIVLRRIMGMGPSWFSEALALLPKKDLRRMRLQKQLSRSVAQDLVVKETEAQNSGKEGGKDVMSIFIRANASEDPKKRLDSNEILSQISTLLIAGHETTANTLGWTLYELSKKPDVQRKVREEVRAVRAQAVARGDEDFTITDLDSMKFLITVLKETLRFHAIIPYLFRVADRDDVLPLSAPQRTVSGDTISAIPVSKGQIIQVSCVAYNRVKSVWGEDADAWRPERFTDGSLPEQKYTLGVFGNLSTFSSGIRACVGWRFSMLEMQGLLAVLIDNFEFSPAPGNPEIGRASVVVMHPMVKGQEKKGTQLPLTVSIAKQD